MKTHTISIQTSSRHLASIVMKGDVIRATVTVNHRSFVVDLYVNGVAHWGVYATILSNSTHNNILKENDLKFRASYKIYYRHKVKWCNISSIVSDRSLEVPCQKKYKRAEKKKKVLQTIDLATKLFKSVGSMDKFIQLILGKSVSLTDSQKRFLSQLTSNNQ